MKRVNRQVPLANRVVGWWRGGNSQPLAGNYNLSRVGGVTTCAGPGWNGKTVGWKFDGSDDYLLCRNDAILIRNSEWTIAAVVRTTSSSGDRAVYCERGASGNDILKLDVTASGNVRIVYRDDAGTLLFPDAGPAINDGKWHTIWFSRKGTNIYKAIDGRQEQLTYTWLGTDTFTNAVESRIGGDVADGTAYFNGDIAEVMIWDRGFYYGTEPYLLDESPHKYYHRQAVGLEDWTVKPFRTRFDAVAAGSTTMPVFVHHYRMQGAA